MPIPQREEEVSKYSKGVQMQVLSMNDCPNSEYVVINMYHELERMVLDWEVTFACVVMSKQSFLWISVFQW